jgi:hypothetical protein
VNKSPEKTTKNRLRFGDQAVFFGFAMTCPHWLKERNELRPNKSEESAIASLSKSQTASPA